MESLLDNAELQLARISIQMFQMITKKEPKRIYGPTPHFPDLVEHIHFVFYARFSYLPKVDPVTKVT